MQKRRVNYDAAFLPGGGRKKIVEEKYAFVAVQSIRCIKRTISYLN